MKEAKYLKHWGVCFPKDRYECITHPHVFSRKKEAIAAAGENGHIYDIWATRRWVREQNYMEALCRRNPNPVGET